MHTSKEDIPRCPLTKFQVEILRYVTIMLTLPRYNICTTTALYIMYIDYELDSRSVFITYQH